MKLNEIIKYIKDNNSSLSIIKNLEDDINIKRLIKYTPYEYNNIDIYEDKHTLLQLKTWLPYQRTKVHSHDNFHESHFKVLRGALYERIFVNNMNTEKNIFNIGDYYFNNNKLHHHQLFNKSRFKEAITIHAYRKYI